MKFGARRSILAGSATIAIIAASSAAFAEPAAAQAASASSADDAQISDIVVTAQHRKESLQSVPIAATVVGADSLTQRNALDVRDISQIVPNLRIDTPYGNTIPKLTLRGVGSGAFNQNSEATVAIYLDDLVLNPVSSKLGQMYDLERIEVLRGPQGTLYGKNTTGGAIKLVSRRPDGTTAASGSFTIARYGEYNVEAAAQTAITDVVSIRVAGKRQYRDGYGVNLFDGRQTNNRNEWAGRFGIRYKDGGTDAYLKLFFDRSRGQGTYEITDGLNADGSPTANRSNPLTGYIRPADIDVGNYNPQYSNVDNRGASFNLDQDLGWATLSSVTGFLYSKQKLSQDNDGSPIIFVETSPYSSKSREFSQELRLASSTESRFSWIAGVTYFHQTVHIDNGADLTGFAGLLAGFGVTIPQSFEQIAHDRTDSFAGFVDGTYHFTDQLSLFGGARITTDKKDFHLFPVNGISFLGQYNFQSSKRWTEPTYRVGLNYQATPSTLLYASYNHGYRAGAYDSSFVTSPAQISGKPADPEFVDNFEGGLKATLFDRTLRFNLAAFYMKFRDQQLPVISALGLCCSLGNAGRSRIYGVELETLWRITSDLDLTVTGSATNGKYNNFSAGGVNYSNAKLGNLPAYEVRVAPEYRVPLADGNFFISPEALFVGKSRRSTTVDPFGQDIQKAYTILNGQAGYRFADNRYSIFAFVKNATNKRVLTDFASSPGFGFKQLFYSAPVTWGLTVTAKF